MNKIGLHIIGGYSGPLGRPRVVKLVDPSVEYVREVRNACGPSTIIVVRWFEPDQSLADPVGAARSWFARHEAAMRAMAAGDPNVAFEGWNEIAANPGDAEEARRYCTMEVERLRLMHGAGLRCVAGNWSPGQPHESFWPAIFQPLLVALKPGDFVGLHEYWESAGELGDWWLCGRWTIVPELKGVPIIISELGRGHGGWRGPNGVPAEQYLAELEKYNAIMEASANVLGGVVFSTPGAGGGWRDYDPSPIWGQVVGRYTAAAWSDPSKAQPVPMPVEPPPAPAPTGPTIVQKLCTNWGYPRGVPGRGGRKTIAICHHIADGSLAALDAWLANPQSGVSYHFGVGKRGEIHQYVNLANAAWHAGNVAAPTWGLLTPGINPNLDTIGVGLEGRPGDVVTEAQYAALLWLDRLLIAQAGIVAGKQTLIGHFEIDSVNRAYCPGPTFPWQRLYSDLGVLPKPREGLPSDETATDAPTLMEKVRWWTEEACRQREAGQTARADAILLDLVDRERGLMYRLERTLKG